MSAEVRSFLPGPMDPTLARAVDRLARTEDVVHIALMPDAHVAEDVCVGTVTATARTLLPAAVGGDIGCGMLTVRLDAHAELLACRDRAARFLGAIDGRVPTLVRPRAGLAPWPDELASEPLSAPSLEALKRRTAHAELGTLGRGNHFVELQRDQEERLWVLVHSGSRAMGPAIKALHESAAPRLATRLAAIDAESDAGRGYLADVAWARRYARANRASILDEVIAAVGDLFGAGADESTRFEVDHDHVRREEHGGAPLWVHRKGAIGLAAGEPGVVPGSMGSSTYHVEGRGCLDALSSSAHGAGRSLSRSEARQAIAVRDLLRQTRGVWFDHRIARRLCEEAPAAYKDIGKVMRVQRSLVRVVRRLEPVLSFKAP